MTCSSKDGQGHWKTERFVVTPHKQMFKSKTVLLLKEGKKTLGSKLPSV